MVQLGEVMAKADMARERRRLGQDAAALGRQLPLFGEPHQRAMPNSLARTALFTVRSPKIPRERWEARRIAAPAGLAVTATSMELRQDDAEVWMQLGTLVRADSHGELDSFVELSGYQMLEEIHWHRTSKDYARLRESIERMVNATLKVEFSNGRRGFIGNLVKEAHWAMAGTRSRERWRIQLSSALLALFQPDDFAIIDWRQRQELRPLAKWLHSFYATHRHPIPYKITDLHMLCGSSNAQMAGYRRDLKGAAEELRRVGFLADWRHEEGPDTLVVRRNLPVAHQVA